MRAYIVTYVAEDGETKTETVTANGHKAVERQFKCMGRQVLNIERDEDEYKQRVRTPERTVGCILVVLALIAIAIAMYWYRVR